MRGTKWIPDNMFVIISSSGNLEHQNKITHNFKSEPDSYNTSA